MARPKGSKNKSTIARMQKELTADVKTANKRGKKAAATGLDKLTDEQVLNLIKERFGIMWKMGKGSTDGSVRSFIISGAPGVGKSHTIESLLEQHGHRNPNFRYKVVKGAITPINLFKLLQDYRRAGDVLVLDDVDSIFFDDDGVAMLKAALDTGTRRHISWLSESHALVDKSSGREYDTEFDYDGTMIFITNTDFQRYVDEGKNKLAPHFEALISRSIYLDLKLHGRRAVALWVKHLVRHNNMLCERFDISKDNQDRALQYIDDNRDRLRTLSIREALKLGQFIKTDSNGWMAMADAILCTDGSL